MKKLPLAWDDSTRTLIIDNYRVTFSETEYTLLWPMKEGTPITYHELAMSVYSTPYDARARMNIEKHIERIRLKLIGSGYNIYCVKGYGYLFWQIPA